MKEVEKEDEQVLKMVKQVSIKEVEKVVEQPPVEVS